MADNNTPPPDPLEFMRNMWGGMGFNLPGIITPTFDTSELDKRIADLRAVEGWLKMNLNMLQITIQNLEIQRATLAAVQAMSQSAQESQANHYSGAWPWPFAAAPADSPATDPQVEKEPASSTDAAPKARPAAKKPGNA